MRSPKWALLNGLGVWVGLVLVSVVLLPLEGQAVHESLKLAALVMIALWLAARYLAQVGGHATATEGLLVGLVWAAVVIALDLGLFAVGAFNIGLGEYFADVASSYLALPVVTVLVMGLLRTRVQAVEVR